MMSPTVKLRLSLKSQPRWIALLKCRSFPLTFRTKWVSDYFQVLQVLSRFHCPVARVMLVNLWRSFCLYPSEWFHVRFCVWNGFVGMFVDVQYFEMKIMSLALLLVCFKVFCMSSALFVLYGKLPLLCFSCVLSSPFLSCLHIMDSDLRLEHPPSPLSHSLLTFLFSFLNYPPFKTTLIPPPCSFLLTQTNQQPLFLCDTEETTVL